MILLKLIVFVVCSLSVHSYAFPIQDTDEPNVELVACGNNAPIDGSYNLQTEGLERKERSIESDSDTEDYEDYHEDSNSTPSSIPVSPEPPSRPPTRPPTKIDPVLLKSLAIDSPAEPIAPN